MLLIYYYFLIIYWGLCLEKLREKIKGVFKWHSIRQTK